LRSRVIPIEPGLAGRRTARIVIASFTGAHSGGRVRFIDIATELEAARLEKPDE
jgi:hypothetical protein